MTLIAKPIRIEPAFEDREQVRSMFERHFPYRAIAAYAPDGVVDETDGKEERSVLPWFRGNWAAGGEPMVEGAEAILQNRKFLEGARTLFGTENVHPQTVVVNLNAPMPAGEPHIDIPSFRGATRTGYPLPFLKVMGTSELFAKWRVLEAGAISWFYEGPGGCFDYWPEGRDGPMLSEQAPFGNVSIVADNDRMYHRIGPIGDQSTELPRMTAAAEMRPAADGWAIFEGGEIRATYPKNVVRLSVLWKAQVGNRAEQTDQLTLDRIMNIFTADLKKRAIEFETPTDPLADRKWVTLLQRVYSESSANRVSKA